MNNQKEQLVSIIIPVYNIAPYISECIESIQDQTYTNIEVIVVDDGSTDGTGEICEKIASYDDRIQVLHQENAGVVSARLRGIEASHGVYLSFVDGDDWVEPDMIETMVKDIGEAELVSTGVWREAGPGKWVEHYDRFPEGYYAGVGLAEIFETIIYDPDTQYIQKLTPWSFNKLFLREPAREAYRQVNPRITFAEDAVFLYKYLLNCHSVVISHKRFYHYRYREESAVHGVDNHRLTVINQVYLALEEDFRLHTGTLLFQLQSWVRAMVCQAVNYNMGFQRGTQIQEFIADLSGLENKRILLYGAGIAGQNAYVQLKEFGYSLALWADKNYRLYQEMELPVVSPEEIASQEYDVIFIAVSEQTLADRIKEELSAQGVPKERLLWRKPMHIF